MKLNLLQKQTSRREMLRGSATLAGSAFLAHLFPASSVRASALSYAQQPSSSADLLASMRAKFNAVPLRTQKLADIVTKFSRSFLQDIFSNVSPRLGYTPSCQVLAQQRDKQKIGAVGLTRLFPDVTPVAWRGKPTQSLRDRRKPCRTWRCSWNKRG